MCVRVCVFVGVRVCGSVTVDAIVPRVDIAWRKSAHTLDCSSPFEVFADLLGVLAVIAVQLLVELHVPFVDVGNVRIVMMCPPTAELAPLLNPARESGSEKHTGREFVCERGYVWVNGS